MLTQFKPYKEIAMYTLALCCAFGAVLSGLMFLPLSLLAETAKKPAANTALQASASASLNWLKVVDAGNYAGSWDKASDVMKMTVPKDEWVKIMEKLRKPLGSIKSREVLDQRTSKNPHGLPPGDYIVMFYKSSFSNKPKANELVTLYNEDGDWLVLTYQID